MRCGDSRCNIKAKINLIKNENIGYPDSEGNIIIELDKINDIILFEDHKIDLKYHKAYIIDYIKNNFSKITKEELFNNNNNNELYLKEYGKFYFIQNPEDSVSTALSKIAKCMKINYEIELPILNKNIIIAKQYFYDNKNKIENFITKLEDIKNNNNNKICKPYPYKLNNGKQKILWSIINSEMKKIYKIILFHILKRMQLINILLILHITVYQNLNLDINYFVY